MIKSLVKQKKNAILKSWFDLASKSYPRDYGAFLSADKNQFSNPVGAAIRKGIETTLDELAGDGDTDKIAGALEEIIKIRAVQDLSPAQAVGFIFDLKKAIRENLGAEIKSNAIEEELFIVDSEIDKIVLSAFELYMKCREKIYDIRANELKNRSLKIIERINPDLCKL